jgi:hypothetical protein
MMVKGKIRKTSEKIAGFSILNYSFYLYQTIISINVSWKIRFYSDIKNQGIVLDYIKIREIPIIQGVDFLIR